MLTYVKHLIPAAALCAMLAAAPLARAGGGVIIDGSVAKPGGAASDDAPGQDETKRAAAEQEQQVFLFFASVMNGPVVFVEETGETSPNPAGTMGAILEDTGGEQAQGCAGAPSLLAALVGLVALLRRRR